MTGVSELTERDRMILRDVIETYLLSGEPVSSRKVAKSDRHHLSSASIRNVMADLEDLGLLHQPHPSAGRVPTSRGYHLFIDDLMEAKDPSDDARRSIDEVLGSEEAAPGELASKASQLLSELSCQVGIVVIPDLATSVLRSIELVPLTGEKVLCVTVTASGFIDHKVVEIDEAVDREELVRIANYLTENYQGMALQDIRDRIVAAMADARAQMDQLMQRALKVAERGLGGAGPDVVVEGTSAVLSQPELADLSRVRTLLELFADRARIVTLLNQCIRGGAVRVLIGDENDLTSSLNFSLIARGYGSEGSALGSLAVFGPSRMEYARLIPLVDYLGNRLSAALARTM